MPRRKDKLASFTNVAPGVTATVELPVDRRYHAHKIVYKAGATPGYAPAATIRQDLTDIRILLDGKEQWTVTAGQLFAMLASVGQGERNGIVPIFFSEPWRRTADAEDFGAWALANQARVFQIEVDIAAGAVNPSLEIWSEFDSGLLSGKSQALGDIKKVRRQVVQVGAAGVVTLDNLPLDGNYARLHMFEQQAGDITNVQIKADDRVLYNLPQHLMVDEIARRGGTVTPGLFSVAFDSTLRIGDFLPTVIVSNNGTPQSRVPIRLDFELANSNNFTLVSEVWGQPN